MEYRELTTNKQERATSRKREDIASNKEKIIGYDKGKRKAENNEVATFTSDKLDFQRETSEMMRDTS